MSNHPDIMTELNDERESLDEIRTRYRNLGEIEPSHAKLDKLLGDLEEKGAILEHLAPMYVNGFRYMGAMNVVSLTIDEVVKELRRLL